MSDRLVSASSAQRWALLVTAVASLMVVLDALVVSTALSAIRVALGASLEELEWTVTGYVLSFAVLLMAAAALGDRFGRRRMFAAGLGLFAAASGACALAPSIGWLIAARAIQGMGAALVMPLALTVPGAAFRPQLRPRVLGIFTGVIGLAIPLGPLLGGAVVEGISWPWIFWLNVPVGLLLIVLAPNQPEKRSSTLPRRHRRDPRHFERGPAQARAFVPGRIGRCLFVWATDFDLHGSWLWVRHLARRTIQPVHC